MKETRPKNARPDPLEVMAQLLEENAQAIQLALQIPKMQRGLLNQEKRRLARKLGPEHPRVKALDNRLQASASLARETERLGNLRQLHPCEVPEGYTVIEGQVRDEFDRPMHDAGVTLTDQQCQGRKGRAVRSDSHGYFAMQLSPEEAQTLRGGGVRIAVHDEAGKPVTASSRPVNAEQDRQTLVLSAPRATVRGSAPGHDPHPPTGGDPEPAPNPDQGGERPIDEDREKARERARKAREKEKAPERGDSAPEEGTSTGPCIDEPEEDKNRPAADQAVRAPGLEKVKGLGPARSRALREHGIIDVRQLLNADDDRLRAIVGNIGIPDLKQQARRLLQTRDERIGTADIKPQR